MTDNEREGPTIIGTAKSLDDGITYEADIVVELPENRAIIYKMRTLSIGEWDEIGRSVPQPQPMVSGFNKHNEPIYDEKSPDYLSKCNAADAQRNQRRLAASLLIDIPGATLAEKGEAIATKMDAGVARQLMAALLALTFGGVGRIDRRADSFHTNGTGHPNGAGETANEDASGVEQPADE